MVLSGRAKVWILWPWFRFSRHCRGPHLTNREGDLYRGFIDL